MGNRSRIDIASDVLEVANGGGANKTQIMYRAVLSHKQMKEYVNFWLEEACLFMTTSTTNIEERKCLRLLKTVSDFLKYTIGYMT